MSNGGAERAITFFQPKTTADLICTFLAGDNRQEALVWKYYMFQQWYDRYLS